MKTKVNGTITNTKDKAEPSKFDAIKEILFGENIETYNKEFEEVKQTILDQKNELLNLIDEVKKELDVAIDNLSTDVNIRITNLEDKLSDRIDALEDTKIDKASLSSLFIKLGNKIND